MDKIHISLGPDSYDIFIANGLTRSAGNLIRDIAPAAKKAAIITEYPVNELYGGNLIKSLKDAGIDGRLLVVPAEEKNRTLKVAGSLYSALVEMNLESNDILIALGGRVVGDLTGFTAATYHRGISYFQFPTSVLSQIGSSIGGKITLDIPAGKSVIGLFYQPKAVFIDPGMVRTLPRRFFRNGMGEAVKLGCVADKELFGLFEKAASDSDLIQQLPEIIRRCAAIKAHYVEKDPLSRGDRRILDFGHTIGGAIERRYRYDNEKITHGEATAIGMYLITKRSEVLGFTEAGTAERLKYVLQSLSLPIFTEIPREKLLLSMQQDKKIHGDSITLTLIRRIGEGFTTEIPLEKLPEYIRTE